VGDFADFLRARLPTTTTQKEQGPSELISGALDEAREIGKSIADTMVPDHGLKERLKKGRLQFVD